MVAYNLLYTCALVNYLQVASTAEVLANEILELRRRSAGTAVVSWIRNATTSSSLGFPSFIQFT